MKRVMITGSNGLLGQKLSEIFSCSANYSVLLTCRHAHSVFDEDAVSYRQLDTTNRQEVRKIIDNSEPDVIINTAAISNVDECENERESAWRNNVTGVENLIYAAKLSGAHLIHISTNYVFDGRNGPYTERDRPNPVNYYGKTKLASENLLLSSGISFTIVRTVVLYGIAHGMKLNFILRVMKEAGSGKSISAADDQIINPTLADDLAYGIMKITDLGRSGIYHIAGSELVSRYEFGVAIARTFGYETKLIIPIKSSAGRETAIRPLKSALVTLKAETELGIRPAGITQGLMVFKNQIMKQQYTDRQV